jgi:uridine kinase
MPPYVLTYQALAASLEHRRPAGRQLLVCIDGLGASGKSTIAHGLARASEDIQVVHVDDFYRPTSDRYVGPLADRPIGADFDLARLRAEVLVVVRSACVANYHVYDWSADRVSLDTVAATQPIVVVEGVYSFSAGLSGFFDFSIWVECPREVRLTRGLARDGEAARSRWEHDWMLGEDQYVQSERPRERAALVCDGSRRGSTADVLVLQERQGLRER